MAAGKATDGGSTMWAMILWHSPLRTSRSTVGIRELLAERMEHGATDEIDRLAVLIEEQPRLARAEWFS